MDISNLLDEKTASLLKNRLPEVVADIRAEAIRFHNRRRVLTGYSYGELYDWDLYFENIFLSFFGVSDYCRNGVEMFLDEQNECGFIPRTMGIVYPKPRHQFKPFLAQIALLGSRQTGSFRWLDGKYYERLKKYLDYWFWYCDFDNNGLCVWDGSDHSGMDNQSPRLGYDGVMAVEGVDLNCYLVRDLEAMAQIASEIGRPGDAAEYAGHATKLLQAIDEVLWDETDGFYYDRNERTGELVRIKTISGLLPLWLGLIPQPRAQRLVREHLMNPEEFWLKYPVATWAKNDKYYYQEPVGGECSWRGSTWLPTNYMVFHGLMRHGFYSEAKELALRSFELVMGEPHTREFYNAETGNGHGLNPFWGWSTLGYMMPLECALNYDPTDTGLTEIVPLAQKYLGLTF